MKVVSPWEDKNFPTETQPDADRHADEETAILTRPDPSASHIQVRHETASNRFQTSSTPSPRSHAAA